MVAVSFAAFSPRIQNCSFTLHTHRSEIHSTEELERYVKLAEGAKRRAATAMNERSSRAHSILQLSLRQTDMRQGTRLHSMLCLADLGGSEQVKKSKVGAADH